MYRGDFFCESHPGIKLVLLTEWSHLTGARSLSDAPKKSPKNMNIIDRGQKESNTEHNCGL